MSLSMPFNAQANIPGTSAEKFPEAVNFLQGRVEKSQIYQGVIASTAVDAQSGTTTNLRMGLLLGLNSSNELTHFAPVLPAGTAVANSSQACDMILATDLSMLDNSTAARKFTGELYGGGVIDPNKLVLASSSTVGIVGNAFEYHIRKQLAACGDFVMEDNLVEPPLFSYKRTVEWANGSHDIEETDRDILHTTKNGASDNAQFTLPDEPKMDLAFYFFNKADKNLTVTATAAEIIGVNSVAKTSVAIQTPSEKIGGGVSVIGDGEKWVVRNMSADPTITLTWG